MLRRLILALAALLATASPAAALPERPLPLGRATLPEWRTGGTLAPGVVHTRIVRGLPSSAEHWTVQVAVTPTRAAARDRARAVRAAGFPARVERITNPPGDDTGDAPLGYRVRSGRFAGQIAATTHRDALTAAAVAGGSVLYTGEDGARTTGPWVIDVIEVDPAAFGGSLTPAPPIPPGERVLAGTGEAAAWLRAHALPRSRLEVAAGLTGEHGPLALAPGLNVVNGGPRLLRDGRPQITAAAGGFTRADDPGFYVAFGVRRNPRTLGGVTADGRVLLMVADGRRPGYAVGLSFAEEAAVIAALGARDAVNLDGGGSSALAVGGVLQNRPSDATGERPVGDALVIRG